MTNTITKKESNIVTINNLFSIIPLLDRNLKIPSILQPHYHALY
jgi:hypothetical protein